MGHNSKIGYPYLPAREPWRGQDRLAGDLPGPADDPGGDTLAKTAWWATLAGTALWHSQKELGGRPWRGRRTTLAGTALWHSQKEPGGRPWRGRRFGTRKKSLADDPGGDGALRAWRATRAGSTTLTGTALWHSQKELAGRPGRLWRRGGGVLALAKRAWRATLAGTALWHSQKELGGRPWRGRRTRDGALALAKRAWRATWRGRRTTLAGMALWHSQKELGGRPWHSGLAKRGGRPWRGRRTPLAGTAGRRTTLCTPSQKELGGRPGEDLAGTAL